MVVTTIFDLHYINRHKSDTVIYKHIYYLQLKLSTCEDVWVVQVTPAPLTANSNSNLLPIDLQLILIVHAGTCGLSK